MADLISRQAAIEALHMHLMYRMGTDSNKKRLDEWINNLPSVQPEIIRCKDCKYNPNPPECGNAACVLFYGMTDQMGFCHHGERREQDETD